MSGKNKAVAIALLLLVCGGAVGGGCAGQLGGDPGPKIVKAEDGGEEEVLSEEDDSDLDEFGRPKDSSPSGVMVSITYLTMSLAAAALPFLTLL